LVILVGLYIPLYQSYKHACVDKSTDGTLITRNALSFAYNYAANDYNSDMATKLKKHDQDAAEMCARFSSTSSKDQANAQAQEQAYASSYEEIMNDIILWDTCINPVNIIFSNESILVPNYTTVFPFLAAEIALRQQCSLPENFSRLDEAVFDCGILPTCNLTCEGPNKAALQAATHDSGCQSEWMVHAGLFRFLLALLVYACVNISRVLIMTSIIRLSWRNLAGRGFEYRASCNRLGQARPDLQNKLRLEVQRKVRKFERGAFWMLLFAILIHIPYLVILQTYGKTN